MPNSGHTADHVIRDNLRWPSTELFALGVVSAILYGAISAGLFLYAKGKVGPRFWTIFAFAGVLGGALQSVHRTAAVVDSARVQLWARWMDGSWRVVGAHAGDGLCGRVRRISLGCGIEARN
jgi:hypothetical protein